MKITIIQPDTKWCNPKANIEEADAAIDRNLGSDLYILPEMWSTGFLTKPKEWAERNKQNCEMSSAVEWMISKANATGAAICGSIATEEDGRWYNRMHFVKPNNEVVMYDKSHLFTYGGEGFEYTAGKERSIVSWKGFRILLQICYDLRFPMWSRNVIAPDGKPTYDMVIYSTNWPVARELSYHILAPARAIENQCFVAICNRVGSDEWGKYFGESAIFHPYGHVIAKAERDKVCEITGEINKDELDHYIKKFPILNDIIRIENYY